MWRSGFGIDCSLALLPFLLDARVAFSATRNSWRSLAAFVERGYALRSCARWTSPTRPEYEHQTHFAKIEQCSLPSIAPTPSSSYAKTSEPSTQKGVQKSPAEPPRPPRERTLYSPPSSLASLSPALSPLLAPDPLLDSPNRRSCSHVPSPFPCHCSAGCCCGGAGIWGEGA